MELQKLPDLKPKHVQVCRSPSIPVWSWGSRGACTRKDGRTQLPLHSLEKPLMSLPRLINLSVQCWGDRAWLGWQQRPLRLEKHLRQLLWRHLFPILIYLSLAALGLHCFARALSSCGERGYSSLRCTGFSLRWSFLLWSTGCSHESFRSCGSPALEHAGFSSCGTWA